ncbi:hypothetical protein N7532_006937 [Penicillium argentinense]|uniref:DMAP1-binding domain-containing protein n=1 Tax=Penicillium argentinense TaxID=1131581 RepID=A0A9W9FGX3_9EURO|nr:uncharacterized protein N7532_006937 [Penicillium argentinense]KAJ5099936.1 hypothetical protein N7532_006937 [Penicillium argentinense]
MAEESPELQSALRNLDRELEEGDITEKGYQKRRTLLLSQFLGPNKPLDINSHATSSHADSFGSSQMAPPAILSVRPPTADSSQPAISSPTYAGGYEGSGGGYGYNHGVSMDLQNSSPAPTGGSYDRDSTGMLQTLDRMPSSTSHDSLFLPKPPPLGSQGQDGSRTATLMSQNYAFNPETQHEYSQPEYSQPEYAQAEYAQAEYAQPEYVDDAMGVYDPAGGVTRQSTMLDSQQGYFSDFAGQQHDDYRDSYGGGFHRYSQSGEAFSPTANMAPPFIPPSELAHGPAIQHLLPLEPRDIPFAVNDPHEKNTPMSNFDNIPAVLRHRARAHPKQPAYWVLDQKGKEIASITWDKLASRAEKVAQVIRDKSNLYRGDRVALIYRETEIIEFAVALMGCFIAGVVAVPINSLDDYQSLNLVLTSTQAHLALTTENNLKGFQRDITAQKLNWPRGVEWWKTNEFGSFHPKKKDDSLHLSYPTWPISSLLEHRQEICVEL